MGGRAWVGGSGVVERPLLKLRQPKTARLISLSRDAGDARLLEFTVGTGTVPVGTGLAVAAPND